MELRGVLSSWATDEKKELDYLNSCDVAANCDDLLAVVDEGGLHLDVAFGVLQFEHSVDLRIRFTIE